MNTFHLLKRTLALLTLSAMLATAAAAQDNGAPDIIVGAGNGGGPMQGGVQVAVGDVTGDGLVEIVEELPPAPLGLLNPEASCAAAPERHLSAGNPAAVSPEIVDVNNTLPPVDEQAKLELMVAAARPNAGQDPVIPRWVSNPWGRPAFPTGDMDDGFVDIALPFGTGIDVLAGPVCTTRHGMNSFGDAVTIVMVWWKGNLPAHDLQNAWFAEAVRIEIDTDQPIALDYRLLKPAATMLEPLTTAPAPEDPTLLNPCIGTPGTRLYAGLEIEPARGPMNVRNAPNGEIVGRFAPGQTRVLAGTPECAGGTIWWPTMQGGWLAEFTPDPVPVALLLPAVQRANDPAPDETPTVEAPVDVQPPVIETTPTPRPTKRPERPTEQPTRPSDPTKPSDPTIGHP